MRTRKVILFAVSVALLLALGVPTTSNTAVIPNSCRAFGDHASGRQVCGRDDGCDLWTRGTGFTVRGPTGGGDGAFFASRPIATCLLNCAA
jgi:hypothetical protein